MHEQFDSDLNFVLSVHGDLHLLEMTESLGKQRTSITMDLFDIGYLSTATRNEIIQSHQDFVQAFKGQMRAENTEVGARFILTFPNEFSTFDHPNISEA